MFVIDDITNPFVLSDIATIGQEYTLSFWLKSEAAGRISVCGSTLSSSGTWQKHEITFTATDIDVSFIFEIIGTYYLYHAQLEIGSKATDWQLAPEDFQADLDGAVENVQASIDMSAERITAAESTIQQLANMISSLIVDGNDVSLMTQTDDGWSFNMGQINDTINAATFDINELIERMGGVDNALDALNGAVSDLGVMTDYVTISTYEGQPCIELGEAENGFKLRITNTQIQFLADGAIPVWISNQKLYVEKAEITNELRFGNFVWRVRSNGNMGLSWEGANN